MWTNEAALKKVRLNAVRTISRLTTRHFDGIDEDAIVDRAHDAWVIWGTLTNFGLREDLGLSDMLL
jgi:hypothetical protein